MKLLPVYFISILLFSCSSTRYWKKVAADPNVTPYKKAIIAPKVAEMFTSETEYLPGETITRTDTIEDTEQLLQFAQIIDSLLFITQPDSVQGDTVLMANISRAILKRFKPTKVITSTNRRDTLYLPNEGLNAELYGARKNLATCETTNTALQAEIDLLKDKKGSPDKWLWWFIGAVVAFVLSIVLHFTRR